jgi:hypothetical protein
VSKEEEYQAHHKCAWCGKLEYHKRMLHYDGKWFCCLRCKINNDNRYILPGSVDDLSFDV